MRQAVKNDGWGGKKLSTMRRCFLNLMDQATEMRPWSDGPSVRAIDCKILRQEFYSIYPADGETEKARKDAKRQAFNRALDAAQGRHLIGYREIDGRESA
jgi:hypothetical protein